MAAWQGTALLTTPRLLLRTYRLDDLPVLAAMNADPEVYRTLGGAPLSRAHSDEIAEWAEQCHRDEGIGLLAVERRADGELLGMCGLHHQESYPDDLEVAWRFRRQFWGQGYATEAAAAWVHHAFAVIGVTRVISMADEANSRSLAVMARLGMAFDHEADIVDDGLSFRVQVWVAVPQPA